MLSNFIFESIDIEEFLQNLDQIKTQIEKIKYASEHLKKLGEGEGRVVFELDDDKVIKLAKEKFGLSQNQSEKLTYEALESNDMEELVPEIFRRGKGYSYLVSEFARPASESDFESLAGISWDAFSSDLEMYYSAYKHRIYEPLSGEDVNFSDLSAGTFSSKNEYEKWRADENQDPIINEDDDVRTPPEFIDKIIFIISQADLMVGDLLYLEHYGVTKNNRLVLIDSGFSTSSAFSR
jgi:hypothetical protein